MISLIPIVNKTPMIINTNIAIIIEIVGSDVAAVILLVCLLSFVLYVDVVVFLLADTDLFYKEKNQGKLVCKMIYISFILYF